VAQGQRAPSNILTLDIEDWRQSAPDVYYPSQASSRSLVAPSDRVIANTHRLLDILDRLDVRATCFVLGSVAEAFPALVREIDGRGHEVAVHGFGHRPVYVMSPEEFVADVQRALDVVQDTVGKPVAGYRAPYFSITRRAQWALPLLAELGLRYDASVYPCERIFYGFPGWDGWSDAPRWPHVVATEKGSIVEVPTTTILFLGLRLPLAGGAFLRFLPLRFFRRTIHEANAEGQPALLYMHPHDLDSEELRHAIPGESLRVRVMRWALNVGRSRNASRLSRLLEGERFTTVREWLETQEPVALHCAEGQAQALSVEPWSSRGSSEDP